MNRRDFFGFLRAAPVALPVLAMTGGANPDGVQMDGKTFYLGGKKVMEQMPDGSLALGEKGSIVLMGENATIEVIS